VFLAQAKLHRRSVTRKILGWEFCDADALHPVANIEKMGRGIPLDDADRKTGWSDTTNDRSGLQEDKNMGTGLFCSQLPIVRFCCRQKNA